MVGKKKGVSGQKEAGQAETGEEGKENREKGGERDVARRRGGAPRRGRGASRGRECKALFLNLVVSLWPAFFSERSHWLFSNLTFILAHKTPRTDPPN